jgi:hypothetical protein
VSEFDQLYREVILDHYKNPRNYGSLEEPHAHAEGQNPLCGDEVSISVRFGIGVLDHTVPARVLVVVEDDLAVELVELAHAKSFLALCTPSASRSTSSGRL